MYQVDIDFMLTGRNAKTATINHSIFCTVISGQIVKLEEVVRYGERYI